jgi:hypothetical protein
VILCGREPSHGPTRRICGRCKRIQWNLRAGRPADWVGSAGRQTRPARESRWGRLALKGAALSPPEDGDGVAALGALAAGGTIWDVAKATGGRSYEMGLYFLKRIAIRGRWAEMRRSALAGMEANLGRAEEVMTAPQIEAARMVLGGASQREAAAQLGVTQAAVSSRCTLACRRLDGIGAAWARLVREGLLDVGRHRNLASFQEKPTSRGKGHRYAAGRRAG